MSDGILSIIGLGSDADSASEEKTDNLQDRKITAAEEAIEAIGANDAEALADAITAIVRTCNLERKGKGKGKDKKPSPFDIDIETEE